MGQGALRSQLVGVGLPLPPAVIDAVRTRLGRLVPAVRDLLMRAAVAGKELDLAILAEPNSDSREAVELVEEAIEADFVRPFLRRACAPGRRRVQ